jgi:glyoxylase-like metal-dependent hydrolase (beta-lactamase superfamily II)
MGGRLMDDGPESIVRRGHLTNHCLLAEAGDALVLVDTGFGLRDVADPASRLSAFFLGMLSPEFREEMTAIRQVEALGFDPADVRHIVLTHLDFDHAGGLDDFPAATVHMLQSERDAALAQSTWLDRQRYRPQQWHTQANWRVYQAGEGDSWFGFSRVRALDGLADEIAMVPLIGHTFGHAGIAVRAGERWLMQAGDAYFFHEEMHPDRPRCTPGLAFYQRMMDKDHEARVWNQARLRELARNRRDEVTVFCSHDVVEFERMTGRSLEVPPDRMATAPGARAAAPPGKPV